MKYTVCIPEVHNALVEVEAKNEKEAIEKAEKQYEITGVPNYLEFSHSLDKELWTVSDEPIHTIPAEE